MRRHLLAGLLTIGLLGPVLVAAPASGAEQGTECSGTAIVTLVPGLSEQPSSGVHNGREGKADCNGPVQGERPTGPMAIEWDGRYGTQDPDTCAKGEGWGIATHTVPTADGPKTFQVTFTFLYWDARGSISGAFQGDYFSGTFQLEPLEGDCVSSPVTKSRLSFRGTWHEHRGAKHVVGLVFLL